MKTWMKVLIVIILMACASGATCFVFYRNLENNSKQDLTITNYLISSQRTAFNEEFAVTKTNCNDERIQLLGDTLNSFEEILIDSNYYYTNFSLKIKNKHEVRKEFESLLDKKTQLYSMLHEYNIKCENSTGFDKHIGSNDLYTSFANFFKQYADFVELLNSKIYNSIESKNVDIKFSVVELYSLVVKNSFSILIIDNDLKTIANSENVEYMNNLMEFENGQLDTISPYFGSSSANFIANYNLCDKNLFAKNLCNNLESVSGSLSDMTTNELTSYYFKEIFGI